MSKKDRAISWGKRESIDTCSLAIGLLGKLPADRNRAAAADVAIPRASSGQILIPAGCLRVEHHWDPRRKSIIILQTHHPGTGGNWISFCKVWSYSWAESYLTAGESVWGPRGSRYEKWMTWEYKQARLDWTGLDWPGFRVNVCEHQKVSLPHVLLEVSKQKSQGEKKVHLKLRQLNIYITFTF